MNCVFFKERSYLLMEIVPKGRKKKPQDTKGRGVKKK